MLLPKKTQRFLRRTAVLDQLCAPLCDAVLGESGGQERLRESRGVELVPRPARWTARVVPLPRPVPGVPARRAAPRRARRHREAAPARRRLVRVERISGAGPGAPAEHDRARPVRPAADRSWCCRRTAPARCRRCSAGLRCWATPPSRATRRSRCWQAGCGADRDGRRRRNGGRRSSTPQSFDQVPLDGTASFDSARAMLRAVMCASGPEQMMQSTPSVRGCPGAAVEPLARHGAPAVRACASARRGRGRGADAVRRGVRGRVPSSATPTRSSTARPSSRCWRWIKGAGPRRPNTSNGPSRSSTSIGCTTTP